MAALTAVRRTTLDDMDLSPGKRARLARLLYHSGPANGTLLMLPYDQGMEHGPRDFFANPDSADPAYLLRLGLEGRFSGMVFQVGLARKYLREFAGKIPLVVKINGKTDVPSDAEAFSPLTASVEEAVRIGADAVGYTLYVGSPAQDRDFIQFAGVRADADRLGMPVIVWAYPRGEAIEKKGGRDSLYAVEYAARIACELGADVVKINVPKLNAEKDKLSPKPYSEQTFTEEVGVRRAVAAAGKTLVLISGGEKQDEEDVLHKAELCMAAGATGLIFGRNLWQRPWEEALRVIKRIHEILNRYGQ